MTTMSSVNQFLSQKQLAIAGASRSGKKFGNTVLRDLTRKGYKIALVHPEAEEIDGHKCYSSLSEIAEQVGGLVLVVPPDQAEQLVRQAVSAGIKNVWMQQGSASAQAVELCRKSGVNEVHGECILMFAQPTGFHKFHRWVWGLIGKLPRPEV